MNRNHFSGINYFLLFFWFLSLIFIAVEKASALQIDKNLGARPIGMGNAFLGLSDDVNLLWYNPASLASLKGPHFQLFDAITTADSTETLSNIYQAVINSQTQNLASNIKPTLVRFNMRTSFLMPYFGFSPYINFNGYSDFSNLSVLLNAGGTLPSPQDLTLPLTVDADLDFGVMAGGAIPLGPNARIGLGLNVFERTAVFEQLTIDSIIAAGGLSSPSSALYTLLQDLVREGWAIQAKLGGLFKIPLPIGYPEWTVAFLIDNLGTTTFRALGGGNPTPSILTTTYNFGTAFHYKWEAKQELNIAIDLLNNFQTTAYLYDQLELGIEYVRSPFSFRVGEYQGYPTFGVSFSGPPHTKIHVASYGIEQGNNLWQDELRVYMIQAVIGMDPL